MKTLIIGAHGKIGHHLTKKMASTNGLLPVAFIRKEEQKKDFDAMGVDSVIGNLQDSVSELRSAIKGFDAVVFAAGSGGETGLEKTMEVDLDGACKAVEAAEAEGVNRFVMVSASHTDDRNFWEKSGMKPYYIAKHYADRRLKESRLDYTILRPTMLTDDTGKGSISIGSEPGKTGEKIARVDVAEAIVECLKHKGSSRKILEMGEGNTPISKAMEEAVA